MARRVSLSLLFAIVVIGAIAVGAFVWDTGRPPQALAAPAENPSLTGGLLVPASAGGPVTLPFEFKKSGNSIDTIFFVLSYDGTLLSLDTTDSDNNEVPDSLTFNLPVGYRTLVTTTLVNDEGRIQVLIFNENSAENTIPAGQLFLVEFDAVWQPVPQLTEVVFVGNPAPFFADTNDEVFEGDFIDGSIDINQIPTFTATPTATGTPTSTATPTVTGTPTDTSTPTPTVTGTPPTPTTTFTPTTTPTNTATATQTVTASPTATDIPGTPAPHYLPALLFGPSPSPTSTPTATASPTASPTPVVSPTPTATATKTATPTPTATPAGGSCRDVVINGGFEDNTGWQLNNTVYPAAYVTFPVYSGARSLRAGIVHPPDNRFSYSSAQQTVFIPAGPPSAALSFRLFAVTTGARAESLTPPPIVPTSPLDRAQLADDVQMVLLFDSSGRQHVMLFQRQWYSQWQRHEIDLSPFRGQAVTLYFGVFNNGTGGVTGMYVDNVALTYCLP